MRKKPTNSPTPSPTEFPTSSPITSFSSSVGDIKVYYPDLALGVCKSESNSEVDKNFYFYDSADACVRTITVSF